jgi:hypothetical protein
MTDAVEKVAYWHRELPPIDAEILGEYTVEATSRHVPGTVTHRDDLWRLCYEDLMTQTRLRLEQEVARLGGHYAHVFDEAIDIRRAEASGEAWLAGRFSYVLSRRPSRPAAAAARSTYGREHSKSISETERTSESE